MNRRLRMNRKSGRRGQSTVEFALMMPIIMAFFFWIMETNIYFIGLHQAGWAAYASSRTHLVSGGPTNMDPNLTMNELLTGRLWTQSNDGRPMLSKSTLRSGGGPDGVIIRLPAIDSLPYVSSPDNPLLHFRSEVSTHLGWSEYDRNKYPDEYERESPNFGRKMKTDNNLRDY